MAGTAMWLVGALLHIKGDWEAFANLLGFPGWAYNAAPCMFCDCTRENMHDYRGLEDGNITWTEIDETDYENAVQQCEVWVTIPNVQMHRKLLRSGKLKYDKKYGISREGPL